MNAMKMKENDGKKISIMKQEKKEQFIKILTDDLMVAPFSVEFKVKKKPAGIKIIYEVTQEQMNAMIDKSANRVE